MLREKENKADEETEGVGVADKLRVAATQTQAWRGKQAAGKLNIAISETESPSACAEG